MRAKRRPFSYWYQFPCSLILHRFFDEFLLRIMHNKMKMGAAQTTFTVKSSLSALTANEAGRIARSFPMIMMSNATSEAAVDSLIRMYPALGQIDREFVWFRSMMEAVAAELMSQVEYVRERSDAMLESLASPLPPAAAAARRHCRSPLLRDARLRRERRERGAWGRAPLTCSSRRYGVKVRAAIGAATSIGDALSDAYMINEYYSTGRLSTARALLLLVGGNVVAQHNACSCKLKTCGRTSGGRGSLILWPL
jgi:hypothetical protein